jgi:hypothetical protein
MFAFNHLVSISPFSPQRGKRPAKGKAAPRAAPKPPAKKAKAAPARKGRQATRYADEGDNEDVDVSSEDGAAATAAEPMNRSSELDRTVYRDNGV